MKKIALFSALAAGLSLNMRNGLISGPYSTPKTGHQRRSKYQAHQGKADIARRKRQIDRNLISPVYSATDIHRRIA